jgi:hypothetical protein
MVCYGDASSHTTTLENRQDTRRIVDTAGAFRFQSGGDDDHGLPHTIAARHKARHSAYEIRLASMSQPHYVSIAPV